jgi:hypothetical protein
MEELKKHGMMASPFTGVNLHSMGSLPGLGL